MSLSDYLPLVGGILDAGSSFINQNAQKGINRENINNSWKMWNANNEYNNPLAQRKRLQNAGMNPNLAYGNGTVANTSAPQQVAKAEAPSINLGGSISKFADVLVQTLNANNIERMADAKLKLMQSQYQKNFQDMAHSTADIDRINASTGNIKQETLFKSQIQPYSLQAMELKNKNMDLDNIKKLKENSYMDQNQKYHIDTMISNLQSAKANRTLTDLRSDVQREILELYKVGLNPSDPLILRYLKGVIPDAEAVVDKVKNWGRSMWNKYTK